MTQAPSLRKFNRLRTGDEMNRLAQLIMSTRNRRAKLDIIKMYRAQSHKLNLLIN